MPSLSYQWPVADIYPHLRSLNPDFEIIILGEIDSTNTQLLNRLHQGETTPTILVAENQTAGKGRMGKTWYATPGHSLTFSILVPTTPENTGWLALVCGCALLNTLQKTLPSKQTNHLKIKWPNDIWCKPSPHTQWHKLAGILIETATIKQQRYAVVGIGININPLPNHPDHNTSQTPRAALAQIGFLWDVPTAFANITPEIAQAVYNFKKEEIPHWKTLFHHYDLLFNQPLYTSSNIEGTGAGIDSQGYLLIKTPSGIQTIHSGEISVRPCSDI